MNRRMPGLPVHHQLPEFIQTHAHRVGDDIQPSHPLSSPSPPAPIPPSMRVFSSESILPMRWPKYWSFSISPSNEHPGLISFRMDWLDLLAVQGSLKVHNFFKIKYCPDTCPGGGLLDHMVVLFSRVLPSPCLQGAKAIYLINCTLGKKKYYKFSALLNTIQSWPKCNQGFSVGMGPLNTRPMLWSIIQSSKRCVYQYKLPSLWNKVMTLRKATLKPLNWSSHFN